MLSLRQDPEKHVEPLVKIAERTLRCFELFAHEQRPLSLSEISRALEIRSSSCYDILQTLEHLGYIYEVEPRGGYYPSLRLLDIATSISSADPLMRRADLALRALRDTLDESVFLSKVDGMEATYLLALQSSSLLRTVISPGEKVGGPHATSAGKALLASLDPQALDAYFVTAELTPFTPYSVTSERDLRQQLESARAEGVFTNRNESEDGVLSISSTFQWSRATYIVSIMGPEARLDKKLAWAKPMLMSICQRLEIRSGAPA
jgi:DNA-binding IclR family transcriptional regulator